MLTWDGLEAIFASAALSNSVCSFKWTSLAKMAATEKL